MASKGSARLFCGTDFRATMAVRVREQLAVYPPEAIGAVFIPFPRPRSFQSAMRSNATVHALSMDPT